MLGWPGREVHWHCWDALRQLVSASRIARVTYFEPSGLGPDELAVVLQRKSQVQSWVIAV